MSQPLQDHLFPKNRLILKDQVSKIEIKNEIRPKAFDNTDLDDQNKRGGRGHEIKNDADGW